MTIKISGNLTHIYRLAPDDPSVIQRRENKLRARWQPFAQYASPERARASLLALRKGQRERKVRP